MVQIKDEYEKIAKRPLYDYIQVDLQNEIIYLINLLYSRRIQLEIINEYF
jgi:hypothetical protein